jgi:diguanylate cyclase (GGDEF)-like protein
MEGTGGHTCAVLRAYALIEAAQGDTTDGEIDGLDREAAARGWADVRLLLCFARSLVARQVGADGAEHVQAMLDYAVQLDDPALLALALAITATRRADAPRILTPGESSSSPLAQAVALLDGADGPVVHRAAAHIEVAMAFHALNMWELTAEHYVLAGRALDEDPDGRWAPAVRRQRRAIAFNHVDLNLDWSSGCLLVGEHAEAAAQAASGLPGSLDAIDDDWPPSWVPELHAHVYLLAAIAGRPPPPEWEAAVPCGDPTDAVVALADAVRASAAGDVARASALAAGLARRLRTLVPANTRLLAMSLAAARPDTPAAAAEYARELERLRWNARLDQVAGMRAGIEVESRRREHEQLRHQVLVDDLTGLANRRGYQSYLAELRQPEDPGDFGVMMVDVDHFKAVNDRFGHDVGDAVLRRIGEVLAAHVRPVDLAARLGGDEFVVVLAHPPPGVAEARAEEIIEAVRRHPWDGVAPGLDVSVSIGVHRGRAGDIRALRAAADRLLYAAKRSGRGRVAAS